MSHLANEAKAELLEGERRRIICPECGGGSSNELSAIASVESGVFRYHCFRASCGSNSYERVGPRARATKTTRTRDKRYLLSKYFTLDKTKRYDIIDTLSCGVLLENATTAVYTGENAGGKQDVIVCEVRGITNGHEGYWIKGTHGLKMSLMEYPIFPIVTCDDDSAPLVMVEDYISACKLSTHFDVLVMCGTCPTKEQTALLEDYVRRRAVSEIFYIPDPDAVSKAAAYARTFNFCDMYVYTSPKSDVKNMDDEEFDTLIGWIQGA